LRTELSRDMFATEVVLWDLRHEAGYCIDEQVSRRDWRSRIPIWGAGEP